MGKAGRDHSGRGMVGLLRCVTGQGPSNTERDEKQLPSVETKRREEEVDCNERSPFGGKEGGPS